MYLFDLEITDILCISFLFEAETESVTSSANISEMVTFKNKGRSLINSNNSKGPIIEPLGPHI